MHSQLVVSSKNLGLKGDEGARIDYKSVLSPTPITKNFKQEEHTGDSSGPELFP